MEERAEKNQVFGMSDVVRQLQTDQIRAQMGANLPVSTIPLPSRGLVYPAESALHGLETVELKAMTVQEENILTSKALIKKGTVITELIKSCIVNKAIDVGQMLSGDRNTLMVAIRSEGYGHLYDVEVRCAACGESAEQQFNLNEFELKPLELAPLEVGKNEFPFRLPKCGKNVTFRFLTGRDEEDIVATQENRKKGLKGGGATVLDDSLILQLQYALVSVEGNYSKNDISNFVRTMFARDSQELRKYIQKHQPGINMVQNITCPHCEHTENGVAMPIGINFFWPNQ